MMRSLQFPVERSSPRRLLLLLFCWSVSSLWSLSTKTCNGAPDEALITELPGFNGSTLPSKHYGGYVTPDEKSGKSLYYYFVTSERDPSNDPLVLWLNGGPGCSSFDGFIYEHGPFNYEASTGGGIPKLQLNPYSWSKVSNMIYLDSPAGVGLSYSNNSGDYDTGDLQTASDSHNFLLKWFTDYPEFLSNPFYISGESYAGVYVPTLSHEVVKGIESGIKPKINFKGYMVGNGVCDTMFDGNALVPFVHGMALISEDLYKATAASCKENYWKPESRECGVNLGKVDTAVELLNIYDILEPCYHDPESSMTNDRHKKLPASFRQLGQTERPLPVRKRMFGRSWPLRAPVREGPVPTWPLLNEALKGVAVPCTNDQVATSWLNDESVRLAIHAKTKNVAGEWALCTSRITFSHDAGSMLPYHTNLTSKGYRALIFSGDHDMCVPYTGTEAWTRSIGKTVTDEWRPWFGTSDVAGYTQAYANNLTFLTIKGAGHTVPEYKPKEALAFYSRWLSGHRI